MKAKWETRCAKCGTTILQGEDIKAQWKRIGYENGKPIWQRVPKAYVHVPKCPKPKPPPDVDPRTGEILRRPDNPQPTLFPAS